MGLDRTEGRGGKREEGCKWGEGEGVEGEGGAYLAV